MNQKAYFNLTYGLFVLTVKDGERSNGCITNTAIQVTAEPGRIAVAVNKSNYTTEILRKTDKFNISIISETADFELFKHFGFQSGRDVDKFADYSDYEIAANGIPYITKGINAYISAEVEQTVDVGTHYLFIAKVTDMEVLNETPSATYGYYHSNIKPKPQKVEDSSEQTTKWRCTICGYEYEGEELPDDFICPICKHPASDFEKVQ